MTQKHDLEPLWLNHILPEQYREVAKAIAAERDRLRQINAEVLAALTKLAADCDGSNLGTTKAPRWAILCAAEAAITKAKAQP